MAVLTRGTLRRAAALALFLALAPAAAMATPQSVELSAAEKKEIGRIEEYLNGIKTLQSRFIQISSNGSQAQGKLSIMRPGMLRFVYDPPVPIEIIADGSWLIYHDKELKQADHYSIDSTPAGILVSENISFSSGKFTIKGFGRRSGIIRLTLIRSEDPEGEITLVFSDRPLVLRKWVITDVQGVVTTVSLTGSRFDVPLDPMMFRFVDPYPHIRHSKEN